jgi:hypothetical protein
MFITGVVATGNKLFTSVQDTSNKPCSGFSVIDGVFDAGVKFIAGDKDTGDQLSPVTTTPAINLLSVSDPREKKSPDPGSRSATLAGPGRQNALEAVTVLEEVVKMWEALRVLVEAMTVPVQTEKFRPSKFLEAVRLLVEDMKW